MRTTSQHLQVLLPRIQVPAILERVPVREFDLMSDWFVCAKWCKEEVRGGQPQVRSGCPGRHCVVQQFGPSGGCSAQRCSVASSNQESKMVSIDGAPLVECSRRRPICPDCGVVGATSAISEPVQFHGGRHLVGIL